MELRRAIPREPADWFGTYRLDSDLEERWRRCRVLDVSTGGAGLELFDSTPDEPDGCRIVVSVQLRGDVRSSVPIGTDLVRVGIEFGDLTGAAASYVHSLKSLGARW